MKTSRVPDVLVEELRLGELTPAEAEAVRQRLAAEPEGAVRLAALADSDAEVLARVPARVVAAEVARRVALADAPRSPARWAAFAAPLAAATLAVVVWLALPATVVPPPSDGARLADSGTRVKGDPRILVHRKNGGAVQELRNGDVARAGDLLQVSYVSAGARHGVIVSVDGRGSVSLHFPRAASEPTSLDGPGAALPYAYELDDAPRFERFFFVTGTAPLDVAAVLDAARALGPDATHPLALPRGVRQVDFVLRKAGRNR